MSKSLIKISMLAGLIAIGGVAAAEARDHGGKMRFEQIDANSDGAVTMEEVKAHQAARFTRADANGDGFLTPEEMRGSDKAQRMLKRFDTNRDGVLDEAELEAAGSERTSKRAERMLERVDANGDGKISMAEAESMRDPAKMFERLDANNDGSLTEEEFAKARGKRRAQKTD